MIGKQPHRWCESSSRAAAMKLLSRVTASTAAQSSAEEPGWTRWAQLPQRPNENVTVDALLRYASASQVDGCEQEQVICDDLPCMLDFQN